MRLRLRMTVHRQQIREPNWNVSYVKAFIIYYILKKFMPKLMHTSIPHRKHVENLQNTEHEKTISSILHTNH